MKKSEFELGYREFSQRTDLVIEIDEVKYYRIFDKTVLTVGDSKLFVVRVSHGLQTLK